MTGPDPAALRAETRRKQRFERELLTCKHYNGAIGPGMRRDHRCKAGINYREHIGGEDTGWLVRLPCLPKPADEDRSRVVACPLREFPTIEEVEAEERSAKEILSLTTTAIKICRDHAGGKRGVAGEAECPKCKGRLHYTVARSNGHLWGQCQTKGCLSWMM